MSLIFAKILGIYLLAIGIGFLIKKERFKNIFKQVSKDKNFLLMGGFLALIIGAVIIALHNEWVWGWPLIITLVGWWSLIKGFALFTYPESIKYLSFIENRPDLFYRITSLVYVVLGLFLLYKGYSGVPHKDILPFFNL